MTEPPVGKEKKTKRNKSQHIAQTHTHTTLTPQSSQMGTTRSWSLSFTVTRCIALRCFALCASAAVVRLMRVDSGYESWRGSRQEGKMNDKTTDSLRFLVKKSHVQWQSQEAADALALLWRCLAATLFRPGAAQSHRSVGRSVGLDSSSYL